MRVSCPSSMRAAGLRAQLPSPVLFHITAILGRGYRRRIAPVWT
ncbi:MAG TPA: hypothetical protein VKQ07_09615 [Jatrophihabitantaceae bacterium]|nr:hypothetical protein [Jatrophihabitantaceae bacterium]